MIFRKMFSFAGVLNWIRMNLTVTGLRCPIISAKMYFPTFFRETPIRNSLQAVAFLFSALTVFAEEEVDFNRDIRPILSDKCFHCHGPDAKNQKSDFRLDSSESALADYDGVKGIVPGDLKKSEVHWRIRMPNDDIDVMPPLDSNRILSNREKDLLDAWIKQGADYDVHWSFKKPVRNELPKLNEENQARVQNPIDHFIFARLEEEKLTPQKEAGMEMRLRRASYTLTGLPPTPEAVDKALKGDPEKAYGSFVDELLASTDYAERQTLRWLDAARYADTDGYQNDSERKNWPWRDWVIKAYHENKPFDEFTIEQLAGDMLPEATGDQILASAFNRNHRQNAEGGALAPEFFVENVIDRVETTSTVWLGLTMGCARCHDHKYDPLSQQEFFQMFAYFNNIGERGTGKGLQANPVQNFRSPLIDPPQELLTALEKANAAEADAKKTLKSRRDAWISEAAIALTAKEQKQEWTLQEISKAEVENAEGTLSKEDDGSLVFNGQNVSKAAYRVGISSKGNQKVTAVRIDALPDSTFGKPRQLARSVNGNFVLTDVKIAIVNDISGKARSLDIAHAAASFEQDNYPVSNTIDDNAGSGWAVFGSGARPESVSAYFFLATSVDLKKGESLELLLNHGSNFSDHNIGKFKVFLTDEDVSDKVTKSTLSPKITSALKTAKERRSAAENKTLADYYLTIDQATKTSKKAVADAEKKLKAVGAESVSVMVMREREGERIPAYLLERGQYDAPDKSKELPRAVPAAFFEGEAEDQPQDRLELARWIISENNPLTPRVIVNRMWQDHFGMGLVKTTEDFGAQSELPTHPELLDWLAVEFMESGWDVNALQKLIVTSATFQQGAAVDPGLLERDPENRLLARGPRYRLDGFSIRDNALQASGLLDRRVGGSPVKPYQPEGLWNSMASGAGTRYPMDKGDDLYRKSLYTYWKRAVNPPRQLIFDSGGREACSVAVRRTNTPLQALVLMNDVTFIEAARNLAEIVLKEESETDKRLKEIYRRVTALSLDGKRLAILQKNLAYFSKHFAEHPEEAAEFLKSGSSPRDESLPVPEHAAWTAAAHLVLNLDTTISLQ